MLPAASATSYDVIILGGGAAGLFCAIESAKRKRRVLVVDHAKKLGEKIRISGGGRCNFTNLHTSPENFLSSNPRFCISALTQFTQYDFIDKVKKHGIAFHEKTLGQLFCNNSSQQIIDMLLDECKQHGVEFATSTHIQHINKKPEAGFTVTTDNKQQIQCQSLVIATGGLSIPKIGATGFGYDIARQFGLNIIEPRAALVPFTLPPELLEKTKPLSGVAIEAIATYHKQSFREGVLFTHRGLSGPAILQISSYWHPGKPLTLNMLPETDVLATLKQAKHTQPKQQLLTALGTLLPKRLAEYIYHSCQCKEGLRLADTPNAHLQQIATHITSWQVTPAGTEGYRTAEVTLGGVDTKELSSKTMESKKVPGLYFIGEVMDVTGHLGGFNFQWAWSSAYAAGRHV